MLGIVNCTNAPTCGFIGRELCSQVAQTCGPCKAGYVGVFGPSNLPCVYVSGTGSITNTYSVIKRTLSTRTHLHTLDGVFGLLGSSCTKSSECVYKLCVDSVCVAPEKSCPSNSLTTICSGHGQCKFFDNSGFNISSCLVNDTSCYSTCLCHDSYGGKDCSVDPESLKKRQDARVSMCRGLFSAVSGTDPSTSVIASLASSLLVTFDPAEMTNSSHIEVCMAGLSAISRLISSGLLKGSDPSLALNVMKTLSLFGDIRIPSDSESTVLDATSSPTSSPTSTPTVSGASHKSVLMSSLESLTDGIIGNMVDGQKPSALVTNNMRIEIKRNLMSDMAGAGLTPPLTDEEIQYGTKPPGMTLPEGGLDECASDSGYAQMSIMKWGKNPYSNSSKIASPLLRFTSSAPGPNRRRLSSSYSYLTVDQSAFYVTIQFSRPTELNGTTVENIPECQLRQGDSYASCGDCSVANATDFNVTYKCYNPGSLCGNSGSGRALQSSDGGSTASEYAAMLLAILKAIADVLTSNPFAISLDQAKNVIMIICGLFFTFIGGLVYFGRWDKLDMIKLSYLKRSDPTNDEDSSKDPDTAEIKDVDISKTDIKVHNNFFKAVIPTSNLLNNDSTIVLFLKKLLKEHDWLRLFSYPSTIFPRFLRYYALILDLMIILFIDTLFFMLQFPSGVCEILPTEEMCLMIKPVFPFGNPTQCSWTPPAGDIAGVCALEPPPSTMFFSIMLTLICLVFGLPLSIFMETIYMSVLCKKPRYTSKYGEDDEDKDQEEEKEEDSMFEVERMIKASTKLIAGDLETSKAKWTSVDTLSYYERAVATAKVLGADEDGSPTPLTFFEWLQFGSRSRLLEYKIKKARHRANQIIEQVKEFVDDDEHHKDVVLMQYFVLEQFSPLRRLILQGELFDLHETKPQTVHYFKWTIAWVFCNGVYAFFLYWMFAWGAKVGNEILKLWGEAFLLVLLQDIFVIAPLKLFIMHGLIIKDLRPQLKQIFHALSNVAAMKVQDDASNTVLEESQVVQHLSPACRAARVFPDLPASWLLRAVADSDYLLCRKERKSRLGLMALVLLSVPLLLSLLGEHAGSFAVETLIPSIWAGFLLINDMIYQISPILLVVVYVGFILYLWVLYRFIKPRRLNKSNAIYLNKKYRRSLNYGKNYYSYLLPPEMRVLLKRWYKSLFAANDESKKLIWKNMNKESFQQARVISSSEYRVKARREIRPHGTVKTIPRQIWKMTYAGHDWKLPYGFGDSFANAKYSRDLAIDFSFDFIDKKINAVVPLPFTGDVMETPLVFEILTFDITKRVQSSGIFRDNDLFIEDVDINLDENVHFENISGSGVEFEILSFDLKKTNVFTSRKTLTPSADLRLQSIPLGSEITTDDDIKIQFEALSDTDSGVQFFRDRKNVYSASDLLLDWQLNPFVVADNVTFEVLTFDVTSIKQVSADEGNLDSNVQFKLSNDRSNVFVEESSGVVFEMLSFDLSKRF